MEIRMKHLLELMRLAKETSSFDSLSKSYHLSYPIFLSFFNGKHTISKEDLIVSSHFVYGWMPRIVTLHEEHVAECLEVLNEIFQGDTLNKPRLQSLKKCINNSVVGVSKLLHFAKPETYPIWDSNVAVALGGEIHTQAVNNADRYLRYVSEVQRVVKLPEFEEVHNFVKTQFTYPVSKVRALEALLFEEGKRKRKDY